ncbi:MAG: hypoxanthine phosphoribosyltransferase [Armatimonadota bacterium]
MSAYEDVREVLISEEAIAARVHELGEQISRDYAGRTLHLVVVLRGAAVFAADLLRALRIPASIDFIAISSYGAETRSSGVVRLLKDLEDGVEGRHVLVVEDIIDTGLTINYLTSLLRNRGVASIEVCALLDKPLARKVEVQARYVGFSIPEAFVVGYGLDYAQLYRGLPYIGVLHSAGE